jgi:hypothetical protein
MNESEYMISSIALIYLMFYISDKIEPVEKILIAIFVILSQIALCVLSTSVIMLIITIICSITIILTTYREMDKK